jgi:hypothetical protein
MKKSVLFLAVFLVVFVSKVNASHIVGGEFELLYSGKGYVYNVFMNMYFDDINAQAGLIDGDLTITIGVFSKATNIMVKTLDLKRQSANLISYNTNGCNETTKLKTRLLNYSGSIDLTGFTEAQGYYISWERCCRNYQTQNIVHQDSFGNYISGQVFYLEFPPVTKSGTRFINSSPVFAPIPAQYLCQSNIATLDFSASDSDGDSLVYKMINPLQGHATDANAEPVPPYSAPYPLITFKPGYSTNNAIHGSPPLNVNLHTGKLLVNPSEIGLFAFAVVCEEYRNGVKIGEVRRDFQFLIISCPITHPPSVGLNSSNNGNSSPGNTNWGTSTPDTLIVKLNKDTCYTIFVTDSAASFYHQEQPINIFYGSTNLPRSVLSFSPTQVTVTPAADTATMNMCFSACDRVLIESDAVYYVDIIVQTNVCPKKSDTLRTYVYVDVEEGNKPPKIGTSLLPTNKLTTYPDTLTSFYVYGTDVDKYDISDISINGDRFTLDDYRMLYTKVFSGPDSIAYRFDWTPNCDDLQKKSDYELDFSLTDKSCIYTHTVKTHVNLTLQDVDTELRNLIPPNLVTPNDDNLNDCFYLPNLPPDNCTYKFKSVEIYNRWGSRVYLSSNRNFKWCPKDFSDGIYYYGIDLTAKYIKGWVQILR